MSKTTVTREYNAQGRLVRETVVTEDLASGRYLHHSGPWYPAIPIVCTCSQPWGSITAPPPCPVHGQASSATITCSTSTTPAEVASDVAMELRRAA